MTSSVFYHIRRVGAGLLVALLLLMQLALPMAAMASPVDLTSLPTVMLYFQTTAEEAPQPLPVMPQLSGSTPVYWATLPAEAFSFPMTMDIVPAMGSPYEYTPANGSPVQTMDAMDLSSLPITITVLQDGMPVTSYPLYVSSLPMPVAQPVNVPVTYVDTDGVPFYSTTQQCFYGQDNMIVVDYSQVLQGYTLVGDDSVYVTVDQLGQANPAAVTFTFGIPAAQEVTGTVTIYYLGANGREVANTQTKELPKGTHTIVPEVTPTGYVLSPECPSSFSVTVDESGVNPSEIIFEYKEDTGAPQEENPPADETGDEPPIQPDPPVVSDIGIFGKVNETVNFRDQPNKTGTKKLFSNMPPETLVWVKGSLSANGNDWYNIIYDNVDCYVVSSFITLLSQEDSDKINYALPSPIPGTETQPPTSIPVSVSYVEFDNPGNVLYSEMLNCAVGGDTTVQADKNKVPGYDVVGDSQVVVSVSADAKATPTTVTFAMQKVAAKGSFTIRYVDGSNNEVATAQTVEKTEGTYDVSPAPTDLQAGYALAEGSPATAQVVIDSQGKANPATVSFTYVKPAVKADVTVNYQDKDGKKIAEPETKTLPEGDNPLQPNAALVPQGYTLTSAASVSVQVNSQGVATPSAVTFTYEKTVVKGSVTVSYKDQYGNDFAAAETVQFDPGPQTVTPNTALIPGGYTLTSAGSVAVTVSDQGQANPNAVTFTYKRPAFTATVTIQYKDADGKDIIPAEERAVKEGDNTVFPDESRIPSGYALTESSSPMMQVVVSAQGIAAPASITFQYKKIDANLYMGYAVTTVQTALRSDANNSDSSVQAMLPKDTLIYINGQHAVGSTLWSGAVTILEKTQQRGILLDSATRHITYEEAEKLIVEYQKAHPADTPTPSPTPPPQATGYYTTIMDNVPLRNMADAYAYPNAWLAYNVVVWVSGQEYVAGQGWHKSWYDGTPGYIRMDQVRKLTDAELQAYLKQNPAETTAKDTPKPYDPYGPSGYGYITSNNVNFRLTPNGSKIKMLNRYALVMIVNSQKVGGTTWYNVNVGGTFGWIHGDYLKTMNITEFNSFLNSNEYYQGLRATSGSTSSGSSTSSGTSNSSGSAVPGKVSSIEDWNVGTWQNPNTNTGLNASYEPFNPYSTPMSPSASPDSSASVQPSATFVIGTMIPITYDDESKETQTGATPWGFIGAGVVLIGGAGGVYAYALNQNKKRKAAAKAAAANRRGPGGPGAPGAPGGTTTTGKPGQGQQSPYARRAVAAPPLSGTQQNAQKNQNATGQSPHMQPINAPLQGGETASNSQGVFGAPVSPGVTGSQNPYARPVGQPSQGNGTTSNPYAQPLSGAGKTADPDQAGRRISRTERYQNAEKGKDDDA